MSIFHFVNRLLKPNPTNEIDALDTICNNAFETAFSRCRLEFGHQMIELMNLKRNLMENIKAPDGSTLLHVTIAKKVLMLLELYFNLAARCAAFKNKEFGMEDSKEESVIDFINTAKSKMDRIYDLIGSLNSQFYQNSDCLNSFECETTLNEAEELYNVLKQSI